MTAFGVVWGLLLLVGGLALAGWGWHAMQTRPGWDGLYGPGALVTTVGAFVALGGVVGLVLALRS